jgi:2'-5' RNA ligase
MVQSVELLLDADSDAVVCAEWSTLVEGGLPSQARHTGATNRPHVTLAVARALDAVQESAIGAAVSGSLPLPLRLGGLLVFGPGPFILCRLVVPSAALLALQRQVVSALGTGSAAFPHQQPGAWTAHVTLARKLAPDQLADAVQLLSPAPDVPAAGTAVRRWDGERKLAWTVETTAAPEPRSDRTGADEQADEVGHHDGDGAEQ